MPIFAPVDIPVCAAGVGKAPALADCAVAAAGAAADCGHFGPGIQRRRDTQASALRHQRDRGDVHHAGGRGDSGSRARSPAAHFHAIADIGRQIRSRDLDHFLRGLILHQEIGRPYRPCSRRARFAPARPA